MLSIIFVNKNIMERDGSDRAGMAGLGHGPTTQEKKNYKVKKKKKKMPLTPTHTKPYFRFVG
jgi:hypothetical protein